MKPKKKVETKTFCDSIEVPCLMVLQTNRLGEGNSLQSQLEMTVCLWPHEIRVPITQRWGAEMARGSTVWQNECFWEPNLSYRCISIYVTLASSINTAFVVETFAVWRELTAKFHRCQLHWHWSQCLPGLGVHCSHSCLGEPRHHCLVGPWSHVMTLKLASA